MWLTWGPDGVGRQNGGHVGAGSRSPWVHGGDSGKPGPILFPIKAQQVHRAVSLREGGGKEASEFSGSWVSLCHLSLLVVFLGMFLERHWHTQAGCPLQS